MADTKNIYFKLYNQIIERTDNYKPVADSRNYLVAVFEFTEEWNNKSKIAIFAAKIDGVDIVRDSPLVADKCFVPPELIKEGTIIVSVVAGDLITANEATITVLKSGLREGSPPLAPTPTIYQQILAAQQATQQSAETASSNLQEFLDRFNNHEFDGATGDHPILQVNETHIQWKMSLEDDTAWRDLFPFSLIKGMDAKNIELGVSATHIQWRLAGAAEWIDLFPLAELKGADAINVEFGISATHIQWRYIGGNWVNLVALSFFDTLYLRLSGGTLTGALVARGHGVGTEAEVGNICYGTSENPPAVALVPEGTLYVQHSP